MMNVLKVNLPNAFDQTIDYFSIDELNGICLVKSKGKYVGFIDSGTSCLNYSFKNRLDNIILQENTLGDLFNSIMDNYTDVTSEFIPFSNE